MEALGRRGCTVSGVGAVFGGTCHNRRFHTPQSRHEPSTARRPLRLCPSGGGDMGDAAGGRQQPCQPRGPTAPLVFWRNVRCTEPIPGCGAGPTRCDASRPRGVLSQSCKHVLGVTGRALEALGRRGCTVSGVGAVFGGTCHNRRFHTPQSRHEPSTARRPLRLCPSGGGDMGDAAGGRQQPCQPRGPTAPLVFWRNVRCTEPIPGCGAGPTRCDASRPRGVLSQSCKHVLGVTGRALEALGRRGCTVSGVGAVFGGTCHNRRFHTPQSRHEPSTARRPLRLCPSGGSDMGDAAGGRQQPCQPRGPTAPLVFWRYVRCTEPIPGCGAGPTRCDASRPRGVLSQSCKHVLGVTGRALEALGRRGCTVSGVGAVFGGTCHNRRFHTPQSRHEPSTARRPLRLCPSGGGDMGDAAGGRQQPCQPVERRHRWFSGGMSGAPIRYRGAELDPLAVTLPDRAACCPSHANTCWE